MHTTLSVLSDLAAGFAPPAETPPAASRVHAGEPVPDPMLLLSGDLLFIPGSRGSMANPRHVGRYPGEGPSSTPEGPATSSRAPS